MGVVTGHLDVCTRYQSGGGGRSFLRILSNQLQIIEYYSSDDVLDSNTNATTTADTWYDVYIRTEGSHMEVWRALQGEPLEKVLETDDVSTTQCNNLVLTSWYDNQPSFDNVRVLKARSTASSFSDDFSGGLGDWSQAGSWSTTNDFAENTNPSSSWQYILRDQAHTDGVFRCTYTLDSRSTAGTPYALIEVRGATDFSDLLRIGFYDEFARVYERLDSTNYQLAQDTNVDSALDQAYDVTVVLEGDHIEVWRGVAGGTQTRIFAEDGLNVLEGERVRLVAGPYTYAIFDDAALEVPDPDIVAYEYNGSNELTKATHNAEPEVSFVYDALGRMITLQQTLDQTTYTSTIQYRYGGKQYQMFRDHPAGDALITYVHNHDGRLRSETLGFGASTTEFHYSGTRIFYEETVAGETTKGMSYVHHPMWPIGTVLADIAGTDPSTGDYRYYARDAHGSPRGVYDDAVALLARQDYLPYGQFCLAAGAATNIGFTGQRRAPSGMYQFPLRDYDAGLSRWTTRDPLGMADGLNMHAYAGGNPASYADPEGGSAVAVIGAAVLGAFGGAATQYAQECSWLSTLAGGLLGAGTGAATAVAGLAAAGALAAEGTLSAVAGFGGSVTAGIAIGAGEGYFTKIKGDSHRLFLAPALDRVCVPYHDGSIAGKKGIANPEDSRR